MLVAIDVGNSNVVIGVYEEEKWKYIWRLPTNIEEAALMFYEMRLRDLLLEAGIRREMVEKTVISSVVPHLTGVLEELTRQLFQQEPLVIAPGIYPHLELRINRPNEIGTDLLANAVAVTEKFRRDCIVVDFGTALTFTTVSGEGAILGVAIAPGLKTAIHALFSKTAQLPEVPLVLPATPVGKNTTHAIQSGVLVGYVGLVKHMLSEIRKEVGDQYIAVATGGLVDVLDRLHEEFEAIEPTLTLDGLRFIARKVGL